MPFGMGITSLTAVAESYDAEDQLRNALCESPLSAITCAGASGKWAYLHQRRPRQLRLLPGRWGDPARRCSATTGEGPLLP